MNTDILLKIPSLLSMRTLSGDKMSPKSSKSSSPSVIDDHFDEESPKPIVHVETNKKALQENMKTQIRRESLQEEEVATFWLENIERGEVQKEVIQSIEREEKEEEKEVEEQKENIDDEDEVHKIYTELMTEEEAEAEMKLITQNAMIELGEQLCEIKMEEKNREKRWNEMKDKFGDYLLDESSLEDYYEDGRWENWMNENEQVIQDFGFSLGNRGKGGRENFVQLLHLVSMYHERYVELEKQEQLWKDCMNESDEQNDDYIHQLEEKEKEYDDLQERHQKVIENFRKDYIYWKHDKEECRYRFVLFWICSSLIQFIFQCFGIRATFHSIFTFFQFGWTCSYFAIKFMILFYYQCCKLILQIVNDYHLTYYIICILAGMQLFQMGRDVYDISKQWKKIKKE
jgi:hypothetical protein